MALELFAEGMASDERIGGCELALPLPAAHSGGSGVPTAAAPLLMTAELDTGGRDSNIYVRMYDLGCLGILGEVLYCTVPVNSRDHAHTPHRTPRLVRLSPQHTPSPSVRGPALSQCEWLA